MSYVVTIRRDSPITSRELVSAIKEDRRFSIEERSDSRDDSITLHWQEDANAAIEFFELANGALDVTSPSTSALGAAQKLAKSLCAEVLGEEGENLTKVDTTSDAAVGCGPFTWVVVGIALLLAVYWLFE